jgi:HPt (histidine-containing phosphotransfer) domain-containing protein
MQALAALLGGTRLERGAAASPFPAPAGAAVAMTGEPVRSSLAHNPRLRPTIRRFAARLDEQMRAFENAAAARNFPELAALAHWLKGAAGTVGYNDFTEPATRLEQAAHAGAAADLDAVMAELRALVARLESPQEEPAAEVSA